MPRSLCFLLVLLSGPVLAFVSYCWFFSPQKFSDLSTHTKKQKQKQTKTKKQKANNCCPSNAKENGNCKRNGQIFAREKIIIITTNRVFDILCVMTRL